MKKPILIFVAVVIAVTALAQSKAECPKKNIKLEKGANIVAVLRACSDVTYEYNADSGIWANIGNVSIIIDEDQLNQKGIELINSLPSDIEPNLKFSPDYIKSDAKILNIEKE